ncbi:MAG: hypothetical protein LBT89_11320 [Planctomycetaceae bacterium]|nr:hypothetical protein [Planctomycetaceae bacterium]
MKRHFIAITLLLLAAGCSSGVRVSGTVTYEDDSSPVTHGSVLFSDAVHTYAAVIRNGRYVTDSKGVLPSAYKITLSDTDKTETSFTDSGLPFVKRTALIDPVYKMTNSSPLSLEVPSGGALKYDIKVKKPPAGTAETVTGSEDDK